MKILSSPVFTSKIITIALLCISASTLAVRAEESELKPGKYSKSDFAFATAAAYGGMMEVKLGEIAAQKASSPGVKQFGEQMVADHGKAGEKLKQLAQEQNATLPSQPTKKQQKEIDRLNGLNGADFDRQYIALMVPAHQKDLKEFKHAAESVENPELKNFAAETSAVVEHHLMMVKNLSEQVRNANK